MVIERIDPQLVDGTKTHGVKIDWDDVFNIYNQLNCPKTVYNPSELPMDKASWLVLTSERNTGKTTNLVLLAMILNLRFGLISAYIRQKADMITPKEMSNFMNVIIQHQYVQKLTNGEFNGVRYFARHYRFVKWAEDGTKEKESEPFLWVGALSENITYKSTLNLPLCNMIIYDEFIGVDTLENEFVKLCDLHKTICRNRKHVKMFLCANTTNYYHEYFKELLIQDEVLSTKANQSFIKATPIGTKVYYKRIADADPQREAVNIEYYGFDNPLLQSITGGDWSVRNYPHIRREERQTIYKGAFIRFLDRLYQIELVYNERLKMHCIVHLATSDRAAEIIYTIEEITDPKESYCFGNKKIDKYIWRLYNDNKWYYSNNDVGFSVNSYVNRADKL